MTKNKNWIATYLLCWFFGILGVHRFYTGYIGIGLVQLFTFGGLGIWALIDFITLSLNNYKDADGNCLEEILQTFWNYRTYTFDIRSSICIFNR